MATIYQYFRHSATYRVLKLVLKKTNDFLEIIGRMAKYLFKTLYYALKFDFSIKYKKHFKSYLNDIDG